MTSFEHALIGIDGALAVGLDRRFGWPIVASAAVAAVLPDWDGLTLLFGPNLFADAHRIWGHNLLVAGLLAAVVGTLLYWWDLLAKGQHALARRWPRLAIGSLPASASKHSVGGLLVWIATVVVATYSHLVGDLVFSANSELPGWGLPLFWPVDRTAWAYPLVPWGDVGTTLVLAGGRFAMVRWSERRQAIARGTLVLVAVYIAVRGMRPW